MGEILIQKSDNENILLFSKAAYSSITKAEQRRAILGEDVVQITVESAEKINFQIGDQVVIFGEKYTLNQLPPVSKLSDRKFSYELTFEGSQYDLLRALYMNEDVSGFSTTAEFPLTADLKMFVQVVLNNANRVFGSGVWSLGECPEGTETKTLTFSSENSLSALQRICKEYEYEFFITQNLLGQKTLNIKKVGNILGHIFEYGPGKGLYNLSRQPASNKEIITRLYAFGSTKNIQSSYRNYSTRLRLPGNLPYIDSPAGIAAFGVIEGAKVFDDIYPKREGVVTAISLADTMQFADTGMNFDLNETDLAGNTKYLLPGTTAKVHFNTGGLAGYEFEVLSYNHSNKTFTIKQFVDDRGQKFPDPASSAFQIAAGDKYVLLEINMPDVYITEAENKLLEAAKEFLDANSSPYVQYALEIDEMFLKRSGAPGSISNFFNLGDLLQIRDRDLEIDKASRINAYTRDLLNPYRYSIQISDNYEVSFISRIVADNKAIKNIVKINEIKDATRARRNWNNVQDTLSLIFDTDGNFTPAISPNSIETQMLSVGARSQQLVLSNTIFEPNYQANKNLVRVTGGSLIHYTISDNIVTWSMQSGTTVIDTDTSRYIYAKCSKTNFNDGSFLFTTSQIKVNQDANFYHFLVGVLHKVDTENNIRWISLTYGSTVINGRFIKTGRIEAGNGESYFDLDSGILGLSGEDNEITAGATGQGSTGASVRFWAGETYENRDNAPFKVSEDGSAVMKKADIQNGGKIGGWIISSGGIVNESGTAYVIARSGTGSSITEAMIGSQVFPSTSGARGAAVYRANEANPVGDNIAAFFEAKNGSFNNFATYADTGISLVGQGLTNGRRTTTVTLTVGIQLNIDPSLCDTVIVNFGNAGNYFLGFLTSTALTIRDGKEITIIAANDINNNFRLYGVIRNRTDFPVNGGTALTVIYAGGNWYVKSAFDNNWE